MKRIIFHWTAGGPKANKTDLKHYHEVINQDLTISLGTHSISDNVSTADGVYAAHTRNLNTGSIEWFNVLVSGVGDLRDPASAVEAVDNLLDDAPL